MAVRFRERLLVAAAALIFAGCGGGAGAPAPDPSPTVPSPSASPIAGAPLDFNGDGTSDLVVHALGTRAGTLGVFFGGADLAGGSFANADVQLSGEEAMDDFGLGISSRDVDRDGCADLLVGAPGANAGARDAGRAYLLRGSRSPTSRGAASAEVIFTGTAREDAFGTSTAMGDVDGDGLTDFLVGAPLSDLGAADGGAAYLFLGARTAGPRPAAEADIVFRGAAANDGAGRAVALADLDGDGLDDILIGAPHDVVWEDKGAGTVYALRGARNLAASVALGEVAVRFSGASGNQSLGTVLAAGDATGDGRPDLLVGHDPSGTPEYVLVLPGAPGFFETPPAGWQVQGTGAWGTSLATGDLDADGVHELLVGSYYAGPDNHGRVTVFRAITGTTTEEAAAMVVDCATYSYFGNSVAGLDVTGDGTDDLVAGAPFSDTEGPNTGRVYVLPGGSIVPTRMAEEAIAVIAGFVGDTDLGRTLGHGDVNGDGRQDLLVAGYATRPDGVTRAQVRGYLGRGDAAPGTFAPDFTLDAEVPSSSLGDSIVCGDYDKDGRDDILVGDWGYSEQDIYAGRACLFLGAQNPQSRSAASADLIIEGTERQQNVGTAVAMGDLDGDGWREIILGASSSWNLGYYTTGRGNVYIFAGNQPMGRKTTDAYDAGTTGGTSFELGTSLAVLDWNGDGVDDLAIGASGAAKDDGSRPGRAFLHFGGEGYGLEHWSDADVTFTGTSDSDLGAVLQTGDVNGDGRPDLVAAAPGMYAEPAGFVAVYLSPGGITVEEPAPSWLVRAESSTDNIGRALAVGDVTSDGVDDIAIGAPTWGDQIWSFGRTYIFVGRARSGQLPATSADHILTGLQEYDSLCDGAVLADFDGDGRDELALGSGFAVQGGWSAGLFMVLDGNGSLPALRLDQPASLVLGDGGVTRVGWNLASRGAEAIGARRRRP